MRCDQLLNRLCLFKTRSQAGKACREGRVRVNRLAARASTEIRPGDRILYRDPLSRYEQEVEILQIPQGSVSRAAARDHYRVLARRVLEETWEPPDGDG